MCASCWSIWRGVELRLRAARRPAVPSAPAGAEAVTGSHAPAWELRADAPASRMPLARFGVRDSGRWSAGQTLPR